MLPGGILSGGILSGGILVQGDFDWGDFGWGILSRGDFGWRILSMGDFVQGDIVRGDFVQGDFVLEPLISSYNMHPLVSEQLMTMSESASKPLYSLLRSPNLVRPVFVIYIAVPSSQVLRH